MPRSIFNGQGYYLNDNRASGGTLEEDALLGCNHCHAPLKKAEWKHEGGFCMGCEKPLCFSCLKDATKNGCRPEVERIARAVEEDYRRGQNARVMGI